MIPSVHEPLTAESLIPPKRRGAVRLAFLCFALGSIGFSIIFYFSLPPEDFPIKNPLVITHGMTLRDISTELRTQHYIAHPGIFEFWAILVGAERRIQGGIYRFPEPTSALKIALALRSGTGTHAARVIFPEGTTIYGMANILATSLPKFSSDKFIRAAAGKEGYLFPDTYFLAADADPESVVKLLADTFGEKTDPVKKFAEKLGYTWSDVVIMASLLEEEAVTFSDRRLVAGILWKRIKTRMPLQVDAPFLYILGKGSLQLTTKDLSIDSPYNTYKYRGLPPTPISNPGIESLVAAVTPLESPYLFYLSDKEGILHYARNFEEHKINKAKYLR